MTPYAVLLVRPLDNDATVRHAFHQLSKQHHPDRPEAHGVPGPLWYALVAAYQAVLSYDRRAAWAKRQAGVSGLCPGCSGSGVRGSRVGGEKVGVCERCHGEGRLT